MPGWRAGSGVGKYCMFRELKTGQQKVQIHDEDESLCPPEYIIYL